MKWLPVIARVLMGIVFTGAGIAAFASRFAFPPDLPEPMATFVKGIAAAIYFMPLLKTMEVLCGLMLLSGRFVSLALVILSPIIVNIFFTHLFLAPSGLPLAAVLIGLETYLVFFTAYGQPVRALFKAKTV